MPFITVNCVELYYEERGSGPVMLWAHGLGQTMKDWDQVEGQHFRYGKGVVSHAPHVRAKWNISASSATLWAPRGPDYGSADLYLDDTLHSRIDFHSESLVNSGPLLTIAELGDTHHSITLNNVTGAIPVDVLDVVH